MQNSQLLELKKVVENSLGTQFLFVGQEKERNFLLRCAEIHRSLKNTLRTNRCGMEKCSLCSIKDLRQRKMFQDFLLGFE